MILLLHKWYEGGVKTKVWIGEYERLLISIMGPYHLLLKDHGNEEKTVLFKSTRLNSVYNYNKNRAFGIDCALLGIYPLNKE